MRTYTFTTTGNTIHILKPINWTIERTFCGRVADGPRWTRDPEDRPRMKGIRGGKFVPLCRRCEGLEREPEADS